MSNFTLLTRRPVAALQATLEHYADATSGAQHLHLATDDEELAFLVAFPTVPNRNDGRAHILEHLALSGSRRFPVANPFFAMMRRSTATFMNAMTYSDRTVYPFASTDRRDFFNLLDVYLDATFFPTLDPLSFLQEGWRYTLDGGQLGLQGVVFNEMKGVYNDPRHVLALAMRREMFGGTTYAVDSGGDPEDIPSISQPVLQSFHASHYHPSQAIFMTAGRLAAADVQARISERVLMHIPGHAPRRMPGLAPAWPSPRRTEVLLPHQGSGAELRLQMAWLLGEATDPMALHCAQMLAHGLLGSASAPVMQAMQAAGFGRPSPMMGLDSSARQMVLHLGMEGLTEDQVPRAEGLIWSALERAALDGVPPEVMRAALRDARIEHRESPGGGMPAGVVRLLKAVPMVMLGGDAMTALDVEPLLVELEQQAAVPTFFKGLVQALLDNPTCLVTRGLPDADFFVKRLAKERAFLQAVQARLTKLDRERIASDNAALAAQQQRPQSAEVLPRILPTEVKPIPRTLPAVRALGSATWAASIPSNGLSYGHVVFDASSFEEADWPWLALCADLLPELGVGSRGFAEAGAWRQSLVPQFLTVLEALVTVKGELKPQIRFFANALREEQGAIATVLQAWISEPRFDEADRIRFLVSTRVGSELSSLGQNGSRYAALLAMAPLSLKGKFDNRVRGTEWLAFCGQLQNMLDATEGLAHIQDKLAGIHRRLLGSPRTVLGAGLDGDGASLAQRLAAFAADRNSTASDAAARPFSAPVMPPARVALDIAGQVNHCVAAWSVPGLTHVSAAALAVMAELMGNQILHRALREQGGAYGGSATYSSEAGIFMMSSYRDPRLAATYADMAAAVEAMATTEFTREQIDEAIICVIKRLDKPQAPDIEALAAWQLLERGVDDETRAAFRHRVLTCTAEDIQRALAWIADVAPSRVAAAGNLDQDLAGLSPLNLLARAGA